MIGLATPTSSFLEGAKIGRDVFAPALSARTSELVGKLKAIQNTSSPSAYHPSVTVRPIAEVLFDALAQVKVLTSQVAMHLDREWRGKLFKQLDSLHALDDWESGDRPIQASSFSTFLKAILDLNPERKPGLGLSHTGYLIAAWTVDKDRLTVEFLENDRVRWVLSRRYNGDVERFAGDTGVARLKASLSSYNSERWFKYAESGKPI